MQNAPFFGAASTCLLRSPMHTMAPTRAAELPACRIRLTTGPAAAAEGHGQGRTAICA